MKLLNESEGQAEDDAMDGQGHNKGKGKERRMAGLKPVWRDDKLEWQGKTLVEIEYNTAKFEMIVSYHSEKAWTCIRPKLTAEIQRHLVRQKKEPRTSCSLLTSTS
eukprot:4654472-Amphidinium_carterae.1